MEKAEALLYETVKLLTEQERKHDALIKKMKASIEKLEKRVKDLEDKTRYPA